MKHQSAQPLGLPPGASRTAARTDTTPANAKTSPLDLWLVRRLLKTAGNPPINIALWDGSEIRSHSQKARARMIIGDRPALYKLISNPDLQLGELYTTGRIQIDGNITVFLETIARYLPDFEKRRWSKLLSKLYLLRRNTLNRAKDNIYHHYDIGNEFYQLWLDERMLYTCAYFPASDITLEQAQLAKMDHVCRKLRLKKDEEVVEAGCGWGALALHMAKHYGVKVKAYNISKEQLAHARQRARAEGLDQQVEFIEGDYRQISGDFDAFVSVGMLEHVGVKQYPDLGAVMDRCLRAHGRGLIHTIGRNHPAPMNAWIEKRIFPGAYPPSLGEMTALFEPWKFSVLDVENLRLHYAETLRHWLARFENNIDKVKAMFDEAFVRAWRMYLAGSTATFIVGDLQLFQVLFNRFDNNDIPATREFMYR